MSCLLEICVESAAAAAAAEQGGADRIELCADLSVGGTTPSPALLAAARAATRLPLVALVRPRAGDFVYSAAELDAMRRAIDAARAGGAQAVALGALRRDGSLALEELAALVEHARAGAGGRLEVCFHRAFDAVAAPGAALEELVGLGLQRVLTSGGPPRAIEALGELAALVEQANGRTTIMPGGGVRAADAARIVRHTGCAAIHSSAGMPAAGDAEAVRRLRLALDRATDHAAD